MKLLYLLRQGMGGAWSIARNLREELGKSGIQVEMLDGTDFIPAETRGKSEKAVTARLKELGANFDLIHAFGYRTAWACAEAFGPNEAWVYTAYDIPKTTHPMLMERLNKAQAGICSTRAVYRPLDEALALDLKVIYPGLPPQENVPDRERARTDFGLPIDAPVIGGLGRLVEERGFHQLVSRMDAVWEEHPDAWLVIGGTGPEFGRLDELRRKSARPDQVVLTGPVANPAMIYVASDLFVVPSSRVGFSMAAAEAMMCSTPVMLREVGGLPEMIEREISGFLYSDEDELASRISDVLGLETTLRSIGSAGRFRAMNRFAIEYCAEQHANVYREIVERPY